MDPLSFHPAAGAGGAGFALLSLIGSGAALFLRRGYLRLRRHASALEAEVERLQDRVWRLAESEERYRSLIEAQLDVIVQRDREGRITFANERFAGLIGEPREALIGSDARPRILESGPVRVGQDGARLIDEAVQTPAGVRWLSWVETTLAGRDGAPEIVRAGRDVTDRVAFQRTLEQERARAEAASEAKSRFLATVSHEFRTPLNGILGMADLLLDTAPNPEQTTYIRAVKTSGEALLSLIDEILDFSKIEAGRLDLAAEPLDVRALVEGVVELLAPKAQGKGIEIASFVARDVPARVVGDPDRLRQILVNLAGNAVKFTEAGGVGVAVEITPAGELALVVQDTGSGIPEDRLPALFKEFEQGEAGHGRQPEGTGLGLAITRRIVERMQGTIAVESRVGQGSSFRVTLALAANAPPPAPGASLSGSRVLIVAQSPFEAPFLARRLAESEATAVHLERPEDAVAALVASSFDVILADRALGDEVIRRLAEGARLAGVRRRIVLLSPFDRREFGPPGAAGFNGYLVKPVRARSLFGQLGGGEQNPAGSAERMQLSAGAKPGSRVLLAEDNEINALLARKVLEKLGAAVDRAKDGEEALALVGEALSGARPPYDLVLMDVRMPGLDGVETTRCIRELERKLGRTDRCRIVALTASVRKEAETATLAAGFDGFLTKPLDIKLLANLVAEEESPLAAAS
jgi:PAS domain S-box-containing protein